MKIQEIRNEVERILGNVDPNGLNISDDSRIYIKDMVQVLIQINMRKQHKELWELFEFLVDNRIPDSENYSTLKEEIETQRERTEKLV